MPVIEELGADHEALLARADDVERAIRRDDGTGARQAFAVLVHDLRDHNAVEEVSVFAALRAAGELLEHVAALADDHLRMWDQVAAIDPLPRPAWDGAVARVLTELRDHIAREEFDLFPATLVAIGPGEWDAVETAAAGARARVC